MNWDKKEDTMTLESARIQMLQCKVKLFMQDLLDTDNIPEINWDQKSLIGTSITIPMTVQNYNKVLELRKTIGSLLRELNSFHKKYHTQK